jgi:cell division protein FtsB
MKKIIFRLLIAGILLFLVVQVFWGKSSLLSQYHIKTQNKQLQATIEQLKNDLESKKQQIELLQSDSAYMEYMARIKLGMSRKGETVFQFIAEDSTK